MVVQPSEWKFKANIARNATFEGRYRAKFLPDLGQKWQKTDYFEKFQFSLSVLKVVSATFLLVFFLSLKESTWESWKNVSYFTSKALFVLEKIKF